MKTLVRGSVAGLLATGAMTVALYAAKAAGLLQTPPPKEITGRAQAHAGVSPAEEPEEAFTLSWVAAHLGFGMAGGAVYAHIKGLIPGDAWQRGLLYGGAVWTVSYLGLMPSLGLYPWPSEDSTTRTAALIAAHAVYGQTLAAAEERIGS